MLIAVESGDMLSSAMAKHPKTFPNLYVKLVLAGEISGKMDVTLEEVASLLERTEETKARVKSALIYPIGVLAITCIALLVLYLFVLPRFEVMFRDLGPDLPSFTRINLRISHLLREQPLVMGAFLVASIFGMRYTFANPVTRAVIDRWGLKFPVLGRVILKAAVARFTRTLATLLSSGVNLMDAMALCADTADNGVVKSAIMKARGSISDGADIASPLRKSGIFPPMVTSMIKVGQETGDLETMLRKVAEFYEKDVRVTVDAAVELIKPMAIVFLAVIVGSVLISVYLPLFSSLGRMAE
jgi:type IV pilus assembly protein PilC